MSRLASFDNDIDFPRLWRIGYVLSLVAVLVGLGAMGIRGMNLGIDFEGGTAWEVPAPGVSVADARSALAEVGAGGAKIQIVGGDTLRVQAEPGSEEGLDEVTDRLADLAQVSAFDVGISTVGPTWGEEISSKALRALVVFFVLISAYIAVRLEWKMAVGALASVVHDLVISVGVYALFQFEITPATVIAFLTIMGYSLYDTIVVYDKVQDNVAKPAVVGRMPYTDLMSLSMNQVLMRSINTTVTSLLPVLSMLVVGSLLLGALTLQEFAIALLVGLLVGAYSSVFVAAPVVAILKEREPHYRTLRQRLENQAGRRSARTGPAGSAAAGSTGSTEGQVGSAAGPSPQLSGRTIPPRPRKKGRRR